MAKFLNKKEQVYDLQLTSYGHYLLSIGSFKPKYYTFLDDNILYDKRYAEVYYRNDSPTTTTESSLSNTSVVGEQQNEIHKRIKQETQYLETITHFDDVERAKGSTAPGDPTSDFTDTDLAGLTENGNDRWFAIDVLPTKIYPAVDRFRLNSVIGDARFEGASEALPAWKIAMLGGEILSSSYNNPQTDETIPQVNVALNYTKKTQDYTTLIDPKNIQSLKSTIGTFIDQKQIVLDRQDGVIYIEEVNTELLNDNFEIEVFEEIQKVGATNASMIILPVSSTASDYDEFILELTDGNGSLARISFDSSRPGLADILGSSSSDLPPYTIAIRVNTASMASKSGSKAKEELVELIEKAYQNAIKDFLAISAEGRSGKRLVLKQLVKGAAGNTIIRNGADARLASRSDSLFEFKSSPSAAFSQSIFVNGRDIPQVWERKYFENKIEQIVDGYMIHDTPQERYNKNYTSGAVEYYFDILTDEQIDPTLACKGNELFNKSSYYIDIDFECAEEDDSITFYDIYGKVTEPEICLD